MNIITCNGLAGWQAFRLGCTTIGRGTTEQEAIENFQARTNN